MEHRAIDFNRSTVEAALSAIPLGGLRVFQTVASTNDEALAWASAGAPDMSLVVADEQTAGRGRLGRRWSTPAGCALALSLIVRGAVAGSGSLGRLSGYGAVAVAEACETLGGMACIKWPNDVLLRNGKVAGVLVEASWSGNTLDGAVVGIGINVLGASAPQAALLRYPATSLEASLEETPDRLQVLGLVVTALTEWRQRLESDAFMRCWTDRLAFRGQDVVVTREGAEPIRGILDGLDADGSLRLITPLGLRHLPMGELHLAADDTIP